TICNLPFAMPLDVKRSFGFAFLTGANLPEIIVRVNAGIMPVAPGEVKRIIAHDIYRGGFYGLGDPIRLNQVLMRPFIRTGGAPARQPQLAGLIAAVVPIAPLDRDGAVRCLN